MYVHKPLNFSIQKLAHTLDATLTSSFENYLVL